ncbi:homocysteine-responsive endoplasmic reticulum-resident ubiquitin-like domain member 2 protein [Hippocampus zosterae]|uniref:homocysteine-responsive endoplasmic reticulum-resident ubiquitin-like domain member 2 protein n=1 Tax=Hippocampus zosterae TaxID=109293 RepID=UPI00223D7497|nr:homocysteine-responsive endoplasmic reticulum-resident ubiquitin-like domain member 2 protein [Hippocampus zosterae]XP_051928569.1 homocysteine-responsive endoplasmic reticulum-resident ubiquitin-like domain member 2 protein [Hippocampus zosterae]
MMAQGVMDGPVTLVIRAPNQKYDDQTINCCQNWTVEKLKAHLSDVYPSKPSSKDQRLVYSGKLLLDHLTLKDVLRKQDEYHMLHLVCPSPTPPSSPSVPRKPRESTAEPAVTQPASFPSQHSHSESNDGRVGFSYDQLHQQFTNSWSHFSAMSTPPTNATPYYNPLTLMWWQQLYARQYYMHYHLLATSSQNPSHDLPRTHGLPQEDPLSQRPRADRRGNPEVEMNAQGGEILNEEDLNRDWLDWVFTFSRAAVLLSIVYFYSSFSRFLMVMTAMLVLYLHQAGWFPFNLENELQLPGENQEEMEAELHNNDLHGMEHVADDSSDDDESGEEGAEDPNRVIRQTGILSSMWSFVITFFMSLFPEGPQNAAN